MSTVEEVATRLAEVVDRLPVTVAGDVADQLDHVVGLVVTASEGSGSHTLTGAVAAFARARDVAYDLVRELRAVAEDIQAYREVLGFHAATASVHPGQPTRRADPRHPASAAQLVAELPVRGPGDKTRGLWVDEHGTRHDLLSGEHDPEYQAANQRAVDLGLVPEGKILVVAAHVEVKFAMRMYRIGISTATIAVNKKPCDGRLGCSELLELFLPERGELTVYGPDGYQRTYRHRGRPE